MQDCNFLKWKVIKVDLPCQYPARKQGEKSRLHKKKKKFIEG